jgi:hypothetical protein
MQNQILKKLPTFMPFIICFQLYLYLFNMLKITIILNLYLSMLYVCYISNNDIDNKTTKQQVFTGNRWENIIWFTLINVQWDLW